MAGIFCINLSAIFHLYNYSSLEYKARLKKPEKRLSFVVNFNLLWGGVCGSTPARLFCSYKVLTGENGFCCNTDNREVLC